MIYVRLYAMVSWKPVGFVVLEKASLGKIGKDSTV